MEIIPLFLILLSLPLASWANEILTYTPGAPSEDQEFGNSGVFKSNVIIPYLGTSGEPVLSIDVAIPENKLASFEAFLNIANADEHTSVSRREFVGSFIQMASSSHSIRHFTVRFGIGDKIKQFSLKENEHVPICLTRPASQDVPIIIKGCQKPCTAYVQCNYDWYESRNAQYQLELHPSLNKAALRDSNRSRRAATETAAKKLPKMLLVDHGCCWS